MDFWNIEKQDRPTSRSAPSAPSRPCCAIAAGAGRRGQWHLMLADILSQINKFRSDCLASQQPSTKPRSGSTPLASPLRLHHAHADVQSVLVARLPQTAAAAAQRQGLRAARKSLPQRHHAVQLAGAGRQLAAAQRALASYAARVLAVLRRTADGHLGALTDGHELAPRLPQVLAPGCTSAASKRLHSWMGLRLQPALIREGPNDYILLRNGQKKLSL